MELISLGIKGGIFFDQFQLNIVRKVLNILLDKHTSLIFLFTSFFKRYFFYDFNLHRKSSIKALVRVILQNGVVSQQLVVNCVLSHVSQSAGVISVASHLVLEDGDNQLSLLAVLHLEHKRQLKEGSQGLGDCLSLEYLLVVRPQLKQNLTKMKYINSEDF